MNVIFVNFFIRYLWMEYYQTIQYIVQSRYPYMDSIIKFEEYKGVINCNDDYVICLPQNEYICLEELMELTRSQYIKIYIGQVILIVNRILEKLNKLFEGQKMTHGNLCPKNIYIQLNEQKFNIIPIQVEIAKIHFVNYAFVNQNQFQLNRIKDIKDVKNSIISWISQYKTISDIKDLIGTLDQQSSLGSIIKLFTNFENHCLFNLLIRYDCIYPWKFKNDKFTFNEDQRKNSLNKVQKFYQDYYQQQDRYIESWFKHRYDIHQDHPFQLEMKEIYKLILAHNQKDIFRIFQIQSVEFFNEYYENSELDGIIRQIKENPIYKHQQIHQYQMQYIGDQIDHLAQRQVSFQQKIQNIWNTQLKLKLLTKQQIASAYKILLAYELSKINCDEMKEYNKIYQIICLCLEQQIDQCLDVQLKKKNTKIDE
ncbi:unnamed protein product (macronuclear) [Paramecium tetraurelia]|uniref:Protein kinase domain-containing protein n=1 Tax=Paramecium tetraurelia TaxID=5888 RepID=A0C9T7_PARTE|nr:uncharacterized protein GSPATT00006861001 [Paramecium tetraurelia]CAK67554.1 unnamed protein product [Paramecium tetraurelia]|eukprot:XP_001434951.1 hypothetical protein (macronuclear) [Paramecium tetraurelia strain d4-2]